ncbi:NAD(P)-dependent oxidoreductase [Caballeronia sp. DA-9]|uniref:NAD(P)-dependent oxidoreductase n=1 Tax=Caballeronia sp. DA-9 TaxID=3436237 RepID=UPI003F66D0A9
MKIAFIGLGNMGAPMAANLLKSGFRLAVHDLDRGKAEDLISAGAIWYDTIHETVRDAEVVMTSLPTPAIVREIATNGGLLASMNPGATWIDLSTNNLEVWQEVCDLAKLRGISTLDAPITGGAEGAKAATLLVLVGGEEAVYQKHCKIFSAIGSRSEYLGRSGAGYVAKISQVVLCYLHSIALAESLMLGVKGGVDPGKMLSIIQNSTGRSYVADQYGPSILNGDYDPTFELGLAIKDMRLTIELARHVSAVLPLCTFVDDMYKRAGVEFGNHAPHLMAVKLLEDSNTLLLRATKLLG